MSEREILKQQLKDTGKPDNILEKMMKKIEYFQKIHCWTTICN